MPLTGNNTCRFLPISYRKHRYFIKVHAVARQKGEAADMYRPGTGRDCLLVGQSAVVHRIAIRG